MADKGRSTIHRPVHPQPFGTSVPACLTSHSDHAIEKLANPRRSAIIHTGRFTTHLSRKSQAMRTKTPTRPIDKLAFQSGEVVAATLLRSANALTPAEPADIRKLLEDYLHVALDIDGRLDSWRERLARRVDRALQRVSADAPKSGGRQR
jgi:hypothetical protein